MEDTRYIGGDEIRGGGSIQNGGLSGSGSQSGIQSVFGGTIGKLH
jgi:hypothetical protein